MAQILDPARMQTYKSFVGSTVAEFNIAAQGKTSKQPVMTRRRLQPHWLLDRTSLQVQVQIVHRFRHDPRRMLYVLVAAVFGFVSWRNVETAGGVSFLSASYDSFDETVLLDRWLAVPVWGTLRNLMNVPP